jgi:hypothetical protein
MAFCKAPVAACNHGYKDLRKRGYWLCIYDTQTSHDSFAETADQISLIKARGIRIALIASMICSSPPEKLPNQREALQQAIKEWDLSLTIALGTQQLPNLTLRETGWIRGPIVGNPEWVEALQTADAFVQAIGGEFLNSESPSHTLVEDFVAYGSVHLRITVDDIVRAIWNDINARRDSAFREARRGSLMVNEAMRQITGISKSVRLISLNAAVEAAHVGSAGRGFAVITQEIRSISEQIEQATSKVTAEVTALQLD